MAIAGIRRRVRHREPRPLSARLHQVGPQWVTCSSRRHEAFFCLYSSLFRRETKEKEEGNEMKRSAIARDEGSTNGERITRASSRPRTVSRRRSQQKVAREKKHLRARSMSFSVLRQDTGIAAARRVDEK